MNHSIPGLSVHHQLPEFTQTHIRRVFLSPIPPSIRVLSNESTLRMRWPKYWSFSFSIIPSKEIPGLISFRRTGWISLQSKGPSRGFSNTTIVKFSSVQSVMTHSLQPHGVQHARLPLGWFHCLAVVYNATINIVSSQSTVFSIYMPRNVIVGSYV